ncbi:nucleotidyltransferase domain-containing protein [Catenulispora pinisilvae]|uniref:nucleotidyltransferase domain-containing protein n=1 Tax=Catenulispora pinisilvae TaxID=2705253 RepID=UPI0018923FF0|nr:nucleotidyltransferase domain-containing protein [Catenulispora pinisilvae]
MTQSDEAVANTGTDAAVDTDTDTDTDTGTNTDTKPDFDAFEPGTVLLSGIIGSTAYGLSGPGSDVDRLGMFAAPTLSLLGLQTPRESHVTAKPDVTFHEAAKLARLALGGNPTASELLWLPDELYERRTPLGDEAIALRTAFLSAPRVHDAYLGYATQQFRKLLSRDPSFTHRKIAKHARHLMRLVDQGHELYTTGHVTVRLADPERCRAFGERVAADPEAVRPFMAAAEERFASARSVLPAEPDTAAAQDWVLRVRKAFWVG